MRFLTVAWARRCVYVTGLNGLDEDVLETRAEGCKKHIVFLENKGGAMYEERGGGVTKFTSLTCPGAVLYTHLTLPTFFPLQYYAPGAASYTQLTLPTLLLVYTATILFTH